MQLLNAAAGHRSLSRWALGNALAAASLSLSFAALLVWHYPLGVWWAFVGFVMLVIAACTSPHAGWIMLPALLPLIGLAPWTGWITFEEFDLLVLAVAISGYGRWVLLWGSHVRPANPTGFSGSALFWVALALFAGSTLVAMARGFANAGGFTFGWFQGYHESMNSLRLVKSIFFAVLLLPLWQLAHRLSPVKTVGAISLGMILGLAGASLTTIWERLAFTDLLNFSSNYRTTGLFWEMHVGGAALDGFLALTMPFAVQALVQARTPVRWAAASTATALGLYACLTTFSRGVYMAVPLGLTVFFVLRFCI